MFKHLLNLERIFELNNPMILRLSQDIFFSLDMVDLMFADHFALFHLLHGQYLPRFLVSDQTDLTESTLSDYGHRHEVTDRDLGSTSNVTFTQFTLLC